VTPTARSMKYFRDRGFIVANVEKILHMPGRPFGNRRDAFGFGDLLIAKPDWGAALIQVTSSDHVSHRVNKIQRGLAQDLTDQKDVDEAHAANENADVWLAAGCRIFVMGWAKRGARNCPKIWTPRIVELTYIYAHELPRKSLCVSSSERRSVRDTPARARRVKPAVRRPSRISARRKGANRDARN
jgi:hypothetical protein